MGISMRMYDIILKKRDGGTLTKEEITYVVKGFTDGTIPDYQMSALLMAIYYQHMSYEETLNLTLEMAKSGDILDLSSIQGIKADKHSTGGVGDKTTLVLGPMVAAVGVKTAKMSGRGLGYTGGTIDKLESIPGFSTSLDVHTFMKNVSEIGIAVTGQTGNLAPADKKMYALRDVTATVDNISLIASSIMSKKLASGADIIVLDVKVGSGAFMKTEQKAYELAREMVRIGTGAGRKVSAVISEMDQPLGLAVGNALEVIEAIDTLKGNGPKDLLELCIALGSHMVVSAGITDSLSEAENLLKDTITNQTAYKKFCAFVKAQGGDVCVLESPQSLIHASIIKNIVSDKSGYISHIKSDDIGKAVMLLGGGRQTKESVIDSSVGFVLRKKVGDYVSQGESLGVMFANQEELAEQANPILKEAFSFSDKKVEETPLIKGIVI